GTLAYQLAKRLPALKPLICEAILQNEDVLRQGLRNQWKELIFIPLSRTSTSGYPTVNIIIDALDECGSDDDIRIILQLLVEVKGRKAADLGVFITSRPKVIIRLGFAAMPEITYHRLDLREIPRSIGQRDISIFLESELDSIRRQHKLRDWPSQHDRQILVERSDCLFIYAKTACRYISDPDWDPEERLSELLEAASTRGAATAGLDAIYLHVLKSALTDGRNEAEVHALPAAFSRPKQVEVALDRLHSVLDVSSDAESPIRLLHPSFRDFLVDATRCRDARFCIDDALMHGELVGVCLETMSTALKRNSCRLPTPGSSPKEVEGGMMDINLPKHVRYACEYWVDHLMGTKSDTRAQYLGRHRSLHAITEDARRFILRNRAIIEEAPLQTYVSALVFSPAESLIRKCYLHEVPSWVNRLPATDVGWGNFAQTLKTNGKVRALAFSPDSRYLACGVKEPDVFQVLFIEFCPDGTRLITGRYDNTVTFWDLSTQAQSFVGIYTEEPLCVAFSHNDQPMVAISDYNIGLGLWDLSQKSLTPTEPRREIHEEVYSLQFSPRGTFIAVSTKKNCMLKLYNTGDYQLVFACDGLDTITLSPSDEHLAAVCPNGTILWHPSTETDRHILVHGPSYVSCLAFSSDGKQLAIGGSGDSVIRIWDPKTKALRHKFEHAQSVSAVTFSLDGARLASLADWQVLDNNMTARLWDISTENLLYESDGFRNPDGLLAISPNNKYITHCYHTESVSVYDLESKERQNFGTGTPYVADLAFSGDSQYVAFTHSTETGLYDINNLQQVAVFPAERLYYGSMSLSADGKYLENYRGRFRTRQLELDIAGGCPKDVNCWSCRDQWIVEGETKMLWLPPEFHRFQTTHHNGLFAFKHENGYRLLGFSQDPGVLDEET
ncbi:MAG: hypothetical protein Q9198_002331, partial [Flavoplaca austrocitrina]